MQLILLRHADSDVGSRGIRDFDRPINAQGRKAADRIGRWMQQNDLRPDYIASSPALRARQTIEHVCVGINSDTASIHWDRRLYLASLHTLIEVLAETPDKMMTVMMVGHFPGLEELLTYLCGFNLPGTGNAAVVTTATLVQIEVDTLVHLTPGSGKLINLIHPEALPD